MEFTKDENGVYTIYLNGTVIPCVYDSQCPGSSICISNVTWISSASCGCAYELGKTGATCDELSQYGIAFVILSIMASLVSLSSFALGAHILFRLFQKRLFGKMQVLTVSIVLAISACFWLLLMSIYCLLNLFVPLAVAPDDDVSLMKTVSYRRLSTVAGSCAFFFVSTSCLNLSLLWIRIARSGSQTPHKYPNLPHIFLLGFYTIFGICLISFIAIDEMLYSFLITLPAILMVLATYTLAWSRMRVVNHQVKHAFDSSNREGSNLTMPEREYRKNLAYAASIASRAAKWVSLSLIACAVCAGVFVFTNNLPYSLPDDDVNSFAYYCFWLLVSLTQSIVVGYLTAHARLQLRVVAKTETSASSLGVTMVKAAPHQQHAADVLVLHQQGDVVLRNDPQQEEPRNLSEFRMQQ